MTFATRGPQLYDLGYEVIPIPAGEKSPAIKGWQSIEITKARVAAWAREYPTANVGVRTKSAPAIDIDVTDEALSDEIERIATRLGLAQVVRVGAAPKRLIVCRAPRSEDGVAQPFRKTVLKLAPLGVDINTRDKDAQKRIQKVEVLGLGQQFVAYGRHPKGHDYTWTSLDELHEVALDALPELTPDGIERLFNSISAVAAGMGWTAQKVGSASHATVSDDALLTYSARADDIDAEKAAEALALVGDAHDYDHWVKVGMALHHQFAGALDGLQMWHEWSARADNYDPKTLDDKWESFHQQPASQTPITFRYVLKYAAEGKQAKKRERMDDIRSEITKCVSTDVLYSRVSAFVGKLLENEIEVDLIVDAILRRGKELDGGSVPARATIRKSVKLAYLSTRVNTNCPDWLKPWAYIEQTEQFYNLETGHALSERAFNNVHNRLMLSPAERTSGQFAPEYQASVVALNKFEIKTLQNFRYMPGADCVFEIEGVRYANTYTSRAVPSVPDEYSDGDLEAIAAFKAHLGLLFENKSYGRIMLDWLAFKVQNLGDHPNWAVIIKGVEGGGKTFFSEAMAGVLGVENVGNVSPTAIKGDFTGWGEGRVLNIIEEIRLSGENRRGILDKLNPYITNSIVPIRRMRTDEYGIANVTAYLLFTNHEDSLPLADSDRRYCVLRTIWQTKNSIEAFMAQNPDYFKNLFTLIRTHKGALRKFLLEHPISEDFEPYGRAPHTDAKQLMMDAARGDDGDDLEALIEKSTDPMVNCYVLNISKLRDLAAQTMTHIPDGHRLASALTHLGYEFVGRARDLEGNQARYWTKHGQTVKVPSFQQWLRFYMTDPFA
ncbi:MAG: PriCT-2 domain-containing protein [Pseudomonadota bacterium]